MVPRGPCLLPCFVWAVLHSQWKVDATGLLSLNQKSPAVSVLISWDVQLQNPATSLGEEHATWGGHTPESKLRSTARHVMSHLGCVQLSKYSDDSSPSFHLRARVWDPPPATQQDKLAECSQPPKRWLITQQGRTRRQKSTKEKGKPEIKSLFYLWQHGKWDWTMWPNCFFKFERSY